ncbi:MAG: hypothetical protein ACR2PZ_09645 [Pseudomonadales bacterium]
MSTPAMSVERLSRLAQIVGGDVQRAAVVHARLDGQVPADWRALAAQLAVATGTEVGVAPRLLGLSGGQGSGKSTLARALVQAYAHCGVRAASVSLDDFYLTRAQRQQLARRVHPLLATRGVPGTHDLPLLQQVFDTIDQPQLRLPVFNKAIDDRLPESQWLQIEEPIDVLIFEGWCVGAVPQTEEQLREPVNELEREADPDGRYRHYVNAALGGTYQAIWEQLDDWLFLAVPNLACVRAWRRQQEQQIASAIRMDDAAIQRFVAHYERLTQWMLQTAPAQARWCLQLDTDHRLVLG